MDVILPVAGRPGGSGRAGRRHAAGPDRDGSGCGRSPPAPEPLPQDHGRLAELDASYSYLRQFTPSVLAVIDFQGGPGTAELMEAVAVLKE